MVSLKTRIAGYSHQFVVFRKKILNSDEFKAFLFLFGQILLYAFLGGMTYLVFTPVSLLIKFIGIGCGLVLFQEKIMGWLVTVFNSITIVKVYK